MTLGIKLKTLRLNKKYTQQFVAQKLSVSSQSISKWENDWDYPSIEKLLLLSDLYQISLDDLLKNDSNVIFTASIPPKSISHLVFTPEMILLFLILCISLIIPILSFLISFGILYSLKKLKMSRHLFIITVLFCIYNMLYLCFFLANLFLQCYCF